MKEKEKGDGNDYVNNFIAYFHIIAMSLVIMDQMKKK